MYLINEHHKRKFRAFLDAERFWVAELWLRQLKIGCKSFFAKKYSRMIFLGMFSFFAIPLLLGDITIDFMQMIDVMVDVMVMVTGEEAEEGEGKGGIQQLRGQNITKFWAPPTCMNSFYIYWAWTKTDIFLKKKTKPERICNPITAIGFSAMSAFQLGYTKR